MEVIQLVDQFHPYFNDLLQFFLDQDTEHAIILLDERGIVVSWLPGAEHVFGYTTEQMVGQNLDRLFTSEDLARSTPEHELMLARANGHAEDDRWQVRNDSTRIWVTGLLMPLRNAQQEIIGFAKVLRDRTDLRAQIERSENRAERLAKDNKQKELFLATLAHELRSPLNALSIAMDLIRLAKPSGEQLLYPLMVIERQAESISRLVDDLLDITRVKAGKLELHKRMLNLNDVVTHACDSCRLLAADRHQEFNAVLLSSPIAVLADPDRLQQVFVNLINNAIKYTPDGGRLWITTSVEADQTVVRVQDTGVGVSADMLKKIFELFTQEDSSRRMTKGGLGLGLPLVKELVTLHGGTVQIRNDGRNKGSEFTVRLPLYHDDEAVTAPESPHPEEI
jgi:PAS domain S-box-containing protein